MPILSFYRMAAFLCDKTFDDFSESDEIMMRVARKTRSTRTTTSSVAGWTERSKKIQK